MLICLVGESGVGKDTLAEEMRGKYGFKRIITHTTRKVRVDKLDQTSHFFVSDIQFQKLLLSGAFWRTKTLGSDRYGLSWSQIEAAKEAPLSIVILTSDDGHRLKSHVGKSLVIKLIAETDAQLQLQQKTRSQDEMPLLPSIVMPDDHLVDQVLTNKYRQISTLAKQLFLIAQTRV